MHALAEIDHPNVLPLLGCWEDDITGRRVLLYELMPNGDLNDFLYDEELSENSLTWDARRRVALGIAQGVEHLHMLSLPLPPGSQLAPDPLVHGSLHPGNILLGDDGEAKLTDTAGARIAFDSDDVHVAPETLGYTPPEYMLGPTTATPEGDVFSFGVVLLELLTGRPPLDPWFAENELGDVIGWVNVCVEEGAAGDVLDPRVADIAECEGEMLEVLKIALVCVGEEAEERPSMADIVSMLERVGDEGRVKAHYYSKQRWLLEVACRGSSCGAAGMNIIFVPIYSSSSVLPVPAAAPITIAVFLYAALPHFT
ncbi:unnamed protein product, partial [Closterium sp. NIES-54]